MKNITTILFILISFNIVANKKSQLNLNLGLDYPDKGQDRSSSATMLKFGISTKPSIFRFSAGFTLSVGSGYKQGELNIGPYIYPLAYVKKVAFQPFLFAEGKFGVGQFSSKARMDTGYGIGTGTDIRFGKSSGITLAAELHSAEEDANRFWLGWYTQY